jgi:hypothetical protein
MTRMTQPRPGPSGAGQPRHADHASCIAVARRKRWGSVDSVLGAAEVLVAAQRVEVSSPTWAMTSAVVGQVQTAMFAASTLSGWSWRRQRGQVWWVSSMIRSWAVSAR